MKWVAVIAVLVGCGDNLPGGVPTRDEIMRACISETACIERSSNLFNCLYRIMSNHSSVSVYRPEQVHCLAAAGPNCNRAGDCVGVTSTSSCPPAGVMCSGSTIISCLGYEQSALQCAGGLWHAADETCVVPAPPLTTPQCGVASCSQPEVRCNGTRIERCNAGVVVIEECAATGDTCVDDVTGPRCGTPLDERCTSGSCRGGLLLACDSVGYQHTVDCPALIAGSTCTPYFGCGFEYQCSDGIEAHCEDDVLSGCVLGVPTKFDCKKAGYAGCIEGRCF